VIIQHAVWLYLRFTTSDRNVEELLAERGLYISYEAPGVFPTRSPSRHAAPTRCG